MKTEKKTANQEQLLDIQIGAYIMQNSMVLEGRGKGDVAAEICKLNGLFHIFLL